MGGIHFGVPLQLRGDLIDDELAVRGQAIVHLAENFFFLFRIEVAERNARNHVVGFAETQLAQFVAETGRILLVNKDPIIVPELLAQMLGQMAIQLEGEQLRVRSQPLSQLAGVASLARAEFDEDPRLGEVHLVQDPTDESFGTGQDVGHLERTGQKAAEEDGTHVSPHARSASHVKSSAS